MKILIVEDDYNKRAQLETTVLDICPGATVDLAKSYQSGLKRIIKASPDLVLLDMTLPTYDVSQQERGGRTRPFGGREILVEIERRHLGCMAIVITQFESFGQGAEMQSLDQLRVELDSKFRAFLLGTIHYQAASTVWRAQLSEILAAGRLNDGSMGVEIHD